VVRQSAAQAPLSPVVRRLMSENGIDHTALVGSGPEGRITRHDVENAIVESRVFKAVRQADEVIPFTRIRRLTAAHMVRSKATSAHTLMVKEVDFEHVEAVRRSPGLAFEQSEGFSLTYLPFSATAVITTLAGVSASQRVN